ncbi:MAG: hypothetical protein AAGC73_04500, partial [Verrucomicrobiota bacterium]
MPSLIQKSISALGLGVFFSAGLSLFGQTSTDLNHGLTIGHDPLLDEITVDWWAKADFYYFLMETEDLATDPWAYFPYAVKGSDGVEGMALSLSADKMFFRVMLTDDLTDPVFSEDFDSDGLLNAFEFMSVTDLWTVDTDEDGTNDFLEDKLGLDPLVQELDIDADGDGFPNSYELRWGTDASDASSYPAVAGVNQAGDGYLYIVDANLSADTTYEKSTFAAAISAAVDDDIIYIKQAVYSENDVIIPAGLSCLFWAEPDTVLSPSSTSDIISGLEFKTGANSRVFGLTVSGFDRGVYISDASPHFYNASFKFNGRAIFIRLRGARPHFYNCIVANNAGSNYPAFDIEGGRPRFINSVFIDNVSSTAAARSNNLCGSSKHNADTYIYNCIFWN